jgi:hypothetical protein
MIKFGQSGYDRQNVNLDPGESFSVAVTVNAAKAKFEVTFDREIYVDFLFPRGASDLVIGDVSINDGDADVNFFGFIGTGAKAYLADSVRGGRERRALVLRPPRS